MLSESSGRSSTIGKPLHRTRFFCTGLRAHSLLPRRAHHSCSWVIVTLPRDTAKHFKAGASAPPAQGKAHVMSSKAAELKAKMAALKERREKCREDNHAAVVEEDRKAKLPTNYEARKRKAQWEQEDEEKRKAAAAAGQDYERVKAREMTGIEAERLEWKKKKKKDKADVGFSDFATAQHRQYLRLTKELKPDMAAYKRSQKEWGDDEADADTLAYGQHDRVTKEGLDALVADIDKQAKKRKNYSRRRAIHQDGDVDFINERNRVFNKKLERFYGKYTQEIKDNLERGTAV